MKKIILIGLLIIGIIFISGCVEKGPVMVSEVFNQSVSGAIRRNTTFSGEILITSDLQVEEGATLKIEPGTIIKFEHWRHGYDDPGRGRLCLTVYGTILSQGTPDMPIRFTSDAAIPEHGDWSALVIRKRGNAIINYTIFEYGWTPVGFTAPEAENLVLENSIIRWSTGANIFIAHGAKAVLENNRIYGAGHNNVEVEGVGTEVTVRYNSIYDASGGGVIVLDNSKVTIEHNLIFGNKGITPYGTSGYGIGIGANGHAVIRYNTIKDHTGPGVMVNSYGSAQIEYNNLENNGVGIQTNQFPKQEKIVAIHNNLKNSDFNIQSIAETDFVDAKQNWFGTTNKTEISLKIQNEEHGNNFGKVIYEPWSSEEFTGMTSEIEYDFEDHAEYRHQAGTSGDIFLYSFPDDETRKVVSRIFESGFPTGITYDGENLWVSNTANDRIYQIDEEGNILKEWNSPGPWPYGIVWAEGGLWVAGYTESKIYKLDENGNTITSFPSPIERPVGLAYDGTYLWTCSFGGEAPPDHYLYKFDKSGNLVEKVKVDREYTGLAWHEGYMWATSNYGSDRIFKIDPENGRIVGWITSSGDRTYGLMWANGYIWTADWTCEQWKEKKIFKLQVLEVKELR